MAIIMTTMEVTMAATTAAIMVEKTRRTTTDTMVEITKNKNGTMEMKETPATMATMATMAIMEANRSRRTRPAALKQIKYVAHSADWFARKSKKKRDEIHWEPFAKFCPSNFQDF